jgi:hypothetical protein
MVRRASVGYRDQSADRIRRLESDLFMARCDIIHLAPEEFHELLGSYYSCSTRSETHSWEDVIAEKVIEKATPIADAVRPDIFGERAYCPLCRGGAQSFYADHRGFSLPEGLRRHLVGFGNTRHCPVMKAAKDLAWEAWNRSFAGKESTEADEARQALQVRRKTETLYVIGPTLDGLLVDESLSFWSKPRSQDGADFSLKWAEQRLFSLGFEIGIDGQRRSYTKTVKHEDGEFVIYADPRQLGDIHFRVFDATVKRGKKAGLALYSFNLRDAWKNNLPAKIAVAVATASKSSRR